MSVTVINKGREGMFVTVINKGKEGMSVTVINKGMEECIVPFVGPGHLCLSGWMSSYKLFKMYNL